MARPSSSPEVDERSTGPLVEPPSALKEFVEATPGPVALLDDEWRIVTHSRQWLEVFQNEGAEARKTSSHCRLCVTMRHLSSSRATGPGVASTNSFSALGGSTRGPVERSSTSGDEEGRAMTFEG